jgi:mitochondrial fission protein ELM1
MSRGEPRRNREESGNRGALPLCCGGIGAISAKGRAMSGPLLPATTTCWVLTDGKAGDEVQCLGVAEALGLTPEIRRVAPRAPWTWAMPWGPVDPREAPGRPGSPIRPPFPDLLIASGRRTVSHLRRVKRDSGGRTFTVFLKDPRTGAGTADLIWVPRHDRLRGDNVLVTLTSPHRVSAERLAAARAAPPPPLAALQRPRVALLLGGDSRHHRFTASDIVRFTDLLERLAGEGVALMATASRRSPPALSQRVAALVQQSGGFFWDGTGENPYLPMLALADAIVVTADSVNMVGEACATGRPVFIFEPSERQSGSAGKAKAYLRGLMDHGAVRFFDGHLESHAYEPLNSTPVIAAAIAERLPRHRIQHGMRP